MTFTVPDDEKVLEGTGDNTVARLVVYDNKAHRASAIDEKTCCRSRRRRSPSPCRSSAGIAGLLVVIVLLVLVLLRGGGGGKRRGGGPPPPAASAWLRSARRGGYGAPPPGGYGQPPAAATACTGQSSLRQAARPQASATPRRSSSRSSRWPRSRLRPLLAVRRRTSLSLEPGRHAARRPGALPACGMNTMATPGPAVRVLLVRPAVCPATRRREVGAVAPPGFPSPSAMNAQPLRPATERRYGPPPGAATAPPRPRLRAGSSPIRRGSARCASAGIPRPVRHLPRASLA